VWDDTRVKSVKVTVMSKEKRSPGFFRKKIGVTPSVATPGDTHPSDTTESIIDLAVICCCPVLHSQHLFVPKIFL